MAEKYAGISSYAFVGNNPIRNIEVDGRYFDKKNGKKAHKIEGKIDKRISKIEKEKTKLQAQGKDIGDRNERIAELNKSKTDIQDMRNDQANEYRYAGIGSNPGPLTSPEGSNGHVIIMHTENNMASKLHESRHGGQVARGETNFALVDGQWTGGNLYGVNDEISAYRAQYSYSGSLKYIEYFNIGAIQGVNLLSLPKFVQDHTISISQINQINAGVVNSMADYRGLNINYTYPKQFDSPKEWSNN